METLEERQLMAVVEPTSRLDRFALAAAQQEFDFGDAPASYGTALVDDGARHVVSGNLHLGAQIDGEHDGQPTDGASGDDATGNSDDEDGVQLPRALFSHLGATVQVSASEIGRLDAWIDFNSNGEFEANEQIADQLEVTAGNNSIPIYVPAGAVAGITYARFRLSSDGGLGPNGEAPDGEVEDYPIEVVVPRQPIAKVFDDPEFLGGRMWLIGGRSKDDVITVSAPDANGTVTARLGANILGTANIGEFDRIVICGFDGDDTITIDPAITKSVYAYGGDGNDTITGGSGNDRLFGGEGKDRLYGEAGNDKLSGDNGPDRLYGGEGDDKINAGEGNDKLLGRAGNDRLYAGAGNDIAYGDEGDDFLSGEKGNDRLWGGNDADVLVGGKGVDWLYGDTGRDLLSGGLNADFVRGYDGDDILIAGYTTHDNFEENMLAIMAEWKSGRGYDERVANILTGSGPVLSDTGIQLVKGRTVFDDGQPDLALGFDDRDWFFASLTEDYQLDQHPDERLN